MDTVFVVVRHFSDSNSNERKSNISFVTSSKALAERVVSKFEETYVGCSYEIVESDFYE